MPIKKRDLFQARDLLAMRSVKDVKLSSDASKLAYSIESHVGSGRPCSHLRIMDLRTRDEVALSYGSEASSNPEWSPDGKWIAYCGSKDKKSGLMLANADGANAIFLASLEGTNAPMPGCGRKVAWAPDSKSIAFVTAVPGPETAALNEDPLVITRYLYKPNHGEGLSHFNDGKRLHIFIADLQTGGIRQLTTGDFSEHSIDWSPTAGEILFVSNRDAHSDQFFKYDVFAVRVQDGRVRQLTEREATAYRPVWSPDGRRIAYQATRRGMTNLETTMEDTHVWTMDAYGRRQHEIGACIDNRQGAPAWSADGKWLYFTVLERGHVRLYRIRSEGGGAEVVINDAGFVCAWSLSNTGEIAYSLWSPQDLPQLYLLQPGGRQSKLTDLNAKPLHSTRVAPVEAFTFLSHDNKHEVEAYVTKPHDAKRGLKLPVVVSIHGGPHNVQGPAFNIAAQAYAARGWATLMVNYRGSTGYGQKFADAIFADQNGNEAHDVLHGLSALMRRNSWIDRDHLAIEGVSYGGQLTAWLVTQTRIFRAAVAVAAVTNLLSYNYMAYYNHYEQMAWGLSPHQGNLMDILWERSALKHVAKAATPVMLMHGENDSDVPIAEAEQFFIALQDVGVETVMVRYPREGHVISESAHIVDQIERSIVWYERQFGFDKARRRPRAAAVRISDKNNPALENTEVQCAIV